MRYQLLDHEGGLYLDVDDQLTVEWGTVELKTTSKGLVVHDTFTHPVLGMDSDFSTSCFGTHPDNPSLQAISARSYERWQASPSIYRTPRPFATEIADEQFINYMKTISHITGPGVFNDVVAERLPHLRWVRSMSRLLAAPVVMPEPIAQSINRTIDEQLPLKSMITVGANHSWRTTR